MSPPPAARLLFTQHGDVLLLGEHQSRHALALLLVGIEPALEEMAGGRADAAADGIMRMDRVYAARVDTILSSPCSPPPRELTPSGTASPIVL